MIRETPGEKSRGAGCLRPALIALAVVALLLTLAACDPEQKPPKAGKHEVQPAKTAKADTSHKHELPPAADVPDGQVGLFLVWESQSKAKPVCEWSKNKVSTPCDLPDPEHETNTWWGLWEHEEGAQKGYTYTLSAEGHGPIKAGSVVCEIAWRGVLHAGVSQGQRCGVSFTLD